MRVSGRSLLPVLFMAIAGAGFAPAATAQTFTTFMKVDGIPGDSVVKGHEDEIVLVSFSQTFGTKNCSRVVATKSVDRASPLLITAATGNLILPTVIITIQKAGAPPLDFFKVTLSSVLIDRIDLGDETGPLSEQVILKPRGIRIEYRPQRADGSLGPPITSDFTCT